MLQKDGTLVNSIKQNTQEREGRKNKERGPKSGPEEENPKWVTNF
jgi:hypothetical protein